MLDESGGPWERQPEGLVQLAPWLPIPQILWFAPLWRDIVGGLAPTVTGTVARAVSRGGVGASFQSGGILDFGDRFNESSFTNLLVFEVPTLAGTALLQQDYDNGGGESAGSQYIDVTAAGDLRLVRDSQAVICETTSAPLVARRVHWAIVANGLAGSYICIDGRVRATAAQGVSWITTGRYVLGRRRPSDLSATSDHIQYLHARWPFALTPQEAMRLTGGQYAELFAPRVEEVFESPAGGGSIAITAATETDTAQPIASNQQAVVGLASETDSAIAIASSQRATLGLASETDSAQALAAHQAQTIGLASETDAAQPISTGAVVSVGLASETDTAQALASNQAASVGLVSETDTAQSISVTGAGTLGTASETDTAQALVANQSATVGLASETDTAQPISRVEFITVGLASETDTAQPIVSLQRASISPALETDTAQEIGITGGEPPAPPAPTFQPGYKHNPRTARDLDPLPPIGDDLADLVRDKWDAIERANAAIKRARGGDAPAQATVPTPASAPAPRPSRRPAGAIAAAGLPLTDEQLRADEEAFILMVAEIL